MTLIHYSLDKVWIYKTYNKNKSLFNVEFGTLNKNLSFSAGWVFFLFQKLEESGDYAYDKKVLSFISIPKVNLFFLSHQTWTKACCNSR